MNNVVLKSYEALVPADQMVVDTLILTLTQKDKQIAELVVYVQKHLDKATKVE